MRIYYELTVRPHGGHEILFYDTIRKPLISHYTLVSFVVYYKSDIYYRDKNITEFLYKNIFYIRNLSYIELEKILDLYVDGYIDEIIDENLVKILT